MSDVVITASPWTNPVVLGPGDHLVGGPNFGQGDGQRATVMLDGPIDTLGLGNVKLDPTIHLKATPRNTIGLVQIRSDGVDLNGCELDASGLGIQLVQSLCWNGKPATQPRDTNFSRIYCHDNSNPGADLNGYNHGLYLQDSVRATGTDMRFERIGGGSAIQFGHACTSANFDRVSALGCFMGFFFWTPDTHDNHVGHCYMPPTTPHRSTYPIDWVNADKTSNTVDYVTVPTPGYGAAAAAAPPTPVPPVPVPPGVDVGALLASVDTELRATSYSYGTWNQYLARGRYPDPLKTAWGRAFAALDKARAAV